MPKRCPRCRHLNAPTDRFCGRCGLVLDERERLQIQMLEAKALPKIMDEITDSGFLDKFKKMLRVVEVLEQNPRFMRLLESELRV